MRAGRLAEADRGRRGGELPAFGRGGRGPCPPRRRRLDRALIRARSCPRDRRRTRPRARRDRRARGRRALPARRRLPRPQLVLPQPRRPERREHAVRAAGHRILGDALARREVAADDVVRRLARRGDDHAERVDARERGLIGRERAHRVRAREQREQVERVGVHLDERCAQRLGEPVRRSRSARTVVPGGPSRSRPAPGGRSAARSPWRTRPRTAPAPAARAPPRRSRAWRARRAALRAPG